MTVPNRAPTACITRYPAMNFETLTPASQGAPGFLVPEDCSGAPAPASHLDASAG